MNTKNSIREWLGLDAVSQTEQDSGKKLRTKVADALMSALDGEDDDFSENIKVPWIKNKVHLALNAAVVMCIERQMNPVLKKMIQDKMSEEEFIDAIVEKINRKQLKP